MRIKILVFCGALLFALAIWPFVVLVNRIEPFVLGLPFYLFWMVLLDVLVAALLAVAYRLMD